MKKEKHLYSILATESAKQLAKNLIGIFLLLLISLSVVLFIMVPAFLNALEGEPAWAMAIAGIILTGFIIVFPVFLLTQTINQYREARALEKAGKVTQGAIVEKWVDTSEGRPIYHVLYKYRRSIKALQVVSESVFQKLQRDQNIDVLHLENAPHISRLNF